VTEEFFADFPAMRDYVNERLPFMVNQELDQQIISGTGSPDLTGILNTANVLTQAKGADEVPDAVFKAMMKVIATGFYAPDAVVMHPLDWQDVRLLKANGIYIWGSPSESGPERIFGLPIAVTTAIAQNTALVGAFRIGAQIFYRNGLMIETTNSDGDDFKYNRIAIRAELRAALVVWRPTAFCTVTGI
jgi:HK97 family phage major capsid protein